LTQWAKEVKVPADFEKTMKNLIQEPIRRAGQQYPFQLWLLFVGMLISRTGASMIWPFLVLYISEQLDLPMVSVTSLLTINSVMGLIASFIAGPIADRTGRKGVMVTSLIVSGLGFVGMIWADSYAEFALLMIVRGAFNPLYQVGSNAMLADLLPPKQRDGGYALMRMGSNLGIAMGPALGGFIASRSYSITFALAAAGMVTYGLLVLFFARETRPEENQEPEERKEPLGGYLQVLTDKPFMWVIVSLTLIMVSATILWTLLAVHAKQEYGISESQFGWIPTTNAAMVVALQMTVTNRTKKRSPLWMMTLGALLYGLGVGSVFLGRGFWAFWGSMVTVTLGELIVVPTAATYAANLAPADKRGRYMSLHSLTWTVAGMIGPVVGGVLSDQLGPSAVWYGGGAFGILSALSFAGLALTAGRQGSRLTQHIPQPMGNPDSFR
jgi:MFS family permease